MPELNPTYLGRHDKRSQQQQRVSVPPKFLDYLVVRNGKLGSFCSPKDRIWPDTYALFIGIVQIL